MYEKNGGMTLIEAMVVMVLECLIIYLLFDIFVNVERRHQIINQLNEIKYTGQTAIDLLNSELHQAGYIGCQSLNKANPVISHVPETITLENRIVGYQNGVSVRHRSERSVQLLKKMHDYSHMYVSYDIKFHSNELLMISDCQHAEIFKLAKVTSTGHGQQLTLVTPLTFLFDKTAEVGRLEINKFYLDKPKHPNEQTYAIFLENIHHEKFELIDKIQQMKLNYLVLQKDQLIELTVDQVTDWSTVKGVTVELRLQQPNFKKTWYAYISTEN